MNRYESRICTFAVPGDWVAEPPFAFREPGEEGDRMGAQILERTLAEMPSAATYAREQKPILAELYEGFELLQEGPQRIEGPGEGYAIFFRYVDEEENPARGKMIFLTCGPQVCQFFLSGPDGDDPERDRLFEAIGKTFAFRGAESLAGAKAGGLTSEILRMPQAEAAKGWQGPWRKFPRCCVELPLPSGWEVAIDERDDVVFRRGNSEIRLHRELGENNEADVWFADRMRKLQEGGDRLIGSEQGELDERGPFAAVLYEERGAVRTWKTAAVMRGLELFVNDQQPLVWTLRVTVSELSGLRVFFESLVAAARFLDSSEWETRTVEPWLDCILIGPWTSQGGGVYARESVPPTILITAREANTIPLADLREPIARSIDHKSMLSRISSQEEGLGPVGRHEGFYIYREGYADTGLPASFRGTWIQAQGYLYSIVTVGARREEVLSTFSSAVNAALPLGEWQTC